MDEFGRALGFKEFVYERHSYSVMTSPSHRKHFFCFFVCFVFIFSSLVWSVNERSNIKTSRLCLWSMAMGPQTSVSKVKQRFPVTINRLFGVLATFFLIQMPLIIWYIEIEKFLTFYLFPTTHQIFQDCRCRLNSVCLPFSINKCYNSISVLFV